MSEHMPEYIIDLEEALKDPDLDLIIDYVSQELDPARVAEVERRLREDTAFQDFAAPIIAAWTAKPKLVTPVIPPRQLERDWDEFTRRAGFTHQRARARRRWAVRILALLALVSAAAVGTVYASRLREARRAEAERALYQVVPAGGRVVTLGGGKIMKVAEGARIRVAPRKDPGSTDTLRVLGSAAVQVVAD